MIHKILKASACFLFMTSIFLPAHAQKNKEWIFPTTAFNEAETAKLMEPGTATIRGVGVIKKKGKDHFNGKGGQIILFPVTPYFTEFLELKKKYRGSKKEATMSNDAFTYRVQGRYIDDQGHFEFVDIKPGKYYIMTWIGYQKTKTKAVQTGTVTSYNVYGYALGSSPIYEDYLYNVDVENELGVFVEVKDAGAVTNVVVSN